MKEKVFANCLVCRMTPQLLWLRHAGPGNADRPVVAAQLYRHHVADTASVPAFIEARFGPQPLQQRDAQVYNLTGGLDFTQPARPPAFG